MFGASGRGSYASHNGHEGGRSVRPLRGQQRTHALQQDRQDAALVGLQSVAVKRSQTSRERASSNMVGDNSKKAERVSIWIQPAGSSKRKLRSQEDANKASPSGGCHE